MPKFSLGILGAGLRYAGVPGGGVAIQLALAHSALAQDFPLHRHQPPTRSAQNIRCLPPTIARRIAIPPISCFAPLPNCTRWRRICARRSRNGWTGFPIACQRLKRMRSGSGTAIRAAAFSAKRLFAPDDVESTAACLLKETEERLAILRDPNFDCLASNTAASALICSDPSLSEAESELNGLVRGLIGKLKGDEAQGRVGRIRQMDQGPRSPMQAGRQGQRAAR